MFSVLLNAVAFRLAGEAYVHTTYQLHCLPDDRNKPKAGQIPLSAGEGEGPSVVVCAPNRCVVGAEGLGGHDDGTPLSAEVGLLDNGRGVGPDNAANRHEESGEEVSTNRTSNATARGGRRVKGLPHPNVAPDPSMYWPSVRMMPFGPAPYLKIFTVPNIGSVLGLSLFFQASVRRVHRTEDEADDHADRYAKPVSFFLFLRTHTRKKNILPPIMAPILTKTQVSLDCSCSAIRLAFERFKLPWASGTQKVPEKHTLVQVGRANTAWMAGRRGHFGGVFELTAEQFRKKCRCKVASLLAK